MLVGRVDVVEVVLHLGDDAAEVGDEAAKDSGLVEAGEGQGRVVACGQHVQEEEVGLRVVAQAVDPPQVARHRRKRQGLEVEPPRLGEVEQFQHLDRLARKVGACSQTNPAVLDEKAVHLPLVEGKARQAQLRLPSVLLLEGGANRAGQGTHVLGDEVVPLHEALDAAGSAPCPKAHRRRDLGLQVEGEALLGTVGEPVQVAANGAQETVRAPVDARGVGGKRAVADEVFGRPRIVEKAADPHEGVQVAQAPLAFLDVRLQEVAAVADALVPGIALGEFGLDEGRLVPMDDLGPKAVEQRAAQGHGAPEVARLQKARLHGEVASRQLQALVDRADTLPHLEPQIPKPVEKKFGHLLLVRGALVGVEEEEVDVGMRRKLAPAVAADRDDGEPFPEVGFGRR